jgi:hypothetical protein
LDWLNDDNREGLSDGKDECTPAIRNRAADGYLERVLVAALKFGLGEALGGTAKPGWSPRKGRRLSSFLGASEPCRNPFGTPSKRRFDRSQKWQDEFETHSENLTAMEAQSRPGFRQ